MPAVCCLTLLTNSISVLFVFQSGKAGKREFGYLKGCSGTQRMLGKMLIDCVHSKMAQDGKTEADALLDSLLTWNCWPLYIQFFCKDNIKV